MGPVRVVHDVAWSRLWLAAFASLLLCGCKEGGRPPRTVPVAGQVLYEGAPLARAQVTFIPVGDADAARPRPSAITDQDGRFVPTTFRERDGAPEGEYVVLIQWRPLLNRGDDVVSGENALHGRYSDPRLSPFKVQVSAARPELEPFRVLRK